MIQVYHLTDFSLSVYAYGTPTSHSPIFPDDFTLVANVLSDDYNAAYIATQNINRAWTSHNSTLIHPHVQSARSTSVGDVMMKGDGKIAEEIVFVSDFGFKTFANIKK